MSEQLAVAPFWMLIIPCMRLWLVKQAGVALQDDPTDFFGAGLSDANQFLLSFFETTYSLSAPKENM